MSSANGSNKHQALVPQNWWVSDLAMFRKKREESQRIVGRV